MFYKQCKDGYKTPIEGIDQKTLVFGEKSLLTEFRMKANSQLPLHRHPYEQTGYLVKGRIRLTIGAEVFDVEVGDSWCVPMNVEHMAEIIEDALAIEVFSPVREDYLPGR